MDTPAASTSAPTVELPLLSARESGLNVSLHPLPLLRRVACRGDRALMRPQRLGACHPRAPAEQRQRRQGCAVKRIGVSDRAVYGALIGVQSGRDVEITNSFELAVSDALEVDHGLFVTRRDQCALLRDASGRVRLATVSASRYDFDEVLS